MSSRMIRHVFFPTNGEASELSAFACALKIAQCARSKLTLMHISRDHGSHSFDSFPAVRELLVRWGELPEGAERADVEKIGPRVSKVVGSSSDVVSSMANFISEHSVDLTVLATHAYSGFDRMRHTTFAEPLARSSGTSTLFVPHGVKGIVDPSTGAVMIKRVLLPFAEAPDPAGAVGAALDLIATFALSAVDIDLLWVGSEEALPQVELPESHGISWKCLVRDGAVVDEILSVAESRQADLIVMASAGHDSFLDALRGSKTERVLREAPCPTLMVQNW